MNSSSSDSDRRSEAPETEPADDLRARFPDPENDPRLKTPRGSDLPEVPKTEFTRPSLPQVEPFRQGRGGSGRGGSGRGGVPSAADIRGAGLASAIGIQLFMSIGGGVGLGALVDKFALHGPTTPWGLITGFFLGAVAGFMNMMRLVNRLNRDDEDRNK